MFDFEALRHDIHEDADLEIHEIIEETDSDITVYNCDGWDETYHLVPPTEEWLRSLLFFGSKAGKWKRHTDRIVQCLMDTDPNMLIMLRGVAFVASKDDVQEMCDRFKVDEELLPDVFIVETDEEFSEIDLVSQHWSTQSIIIINIDCIERTSKEISIDIYDEINIVTDGVFVTLLHELRHLGLENPYLPEDKYPPSFAEEGNVEEWARNEYDRIRHQCEHAVKREKGGNN